MGDPLSLLRQYNVTKEEIIECDDQIKFGEHSWPKNAKTIYPISNKNSGSKEYYTLECLLFLLKNVELVHPEYCKAAEAANVPAVRRPDRKKLLEYLNGATATCASIDNSTSVEKPKPGKRTHNNNPGQTGMKKPRVEYHGARKGKRRRV